MKCSVLESRTGLLLAVLVASITAPAVAGDANDDLQAVRKAVLATSVAQARPPAEDPGGAPAEARPQRGKDQPMWFRVRIKEKSGKRGRVSVNLPIGIARALGDDWPIRSSRACHKRDRCDVTLGELLRALDGGQSLVEIENDDAKVRVWVE